MIREGSTTINGANKAQASNNDDGNDANITAAAAAAQAAAMNRPQTSGNTIRQNPTNMSTHQQVKAATLTNGNSGSQNVGGYKQGKKNLLENRESDIEN